MPTKIARERNCVEKEKIDSLNKRLALRRLVAARATQNTSRATPFVAFCSATFGAGVVAAQRPITCPKRQLPRTLCDSWHKMILF
jgi:hypothetical protein